MGKRRGEFNSEGVGGEGRGRDESRRPRQARTRKQRKISNWNQVSDRVRGRLNSVKRAAFPLAKKKKKYMNVSEKGGKIIIENPLAFE